MNRDDIIRMAREAAVINCDCCLPFWPEEDQVNWEIFFERFANLIATAEREAFDAKYPIQLTHDQYNVVINAALKDEREAIAKMIEDAPPLVDFAKNEHDGCLICGFTPKLFAFTIRERGAL